MWGHISMQEPFDHRDDGIKGNPKLVEVVLRLLMCHLYYSGKCKCNSKG